MDAYPGALCPWNFPFFLFPSIQVEKNAHSMGSHCHGALPKYHEAEQPHTQSPETMNQINLPFCKLFLLSILVTTIKSSQCRWLEKWFSVKAALPEGLCLIPSTQMVTHNHL